MSLGSAVLMGCAGGKGPVAPPVDVDTLDLFLEPVPAAAGYLHYAGPTRSYRGPVRAEVTNSADPLSFEFEDFAEAEVIRVSVLSADPPAFGRGPGGEWIDVGSYEHRGSVHTLQLDRAWGDGRQAKMLLELDLQPTPQAPPSDWLQPGTRLFYGVAFTDKPITKIVPMGVMVTIEEPDEPGGWTFSWRADLDENTRTDVRGRTWQQGRRRVSAELAESSSRHADGFDETVPDSFYEGATSVFLSRSTARNLSTYGGAAFDDAALEGTSVMERVAEKEVVLRADGDLWSVPAWITTVNKGEGVYVVAQDLEAPLLLSASRPEWQMRLMAVATPTD